jgi:hypothetical protein
MISRCQGRSFSRFRPGARRCGDGPFDGRGDTSLAAFGSLDRSRRSGDLPLRPSLNLMLPGCNSS